MNSTPRLARKLSFESASSMQFEERDSLEPLRKPISKPPPKPQLDISCMLCQLRTKDVKCIACKGKGKICSGSPFLHFVNSIMEFKLNGTVKNSAKTTRIIQFSKLSVTKSANIQSIRCSYVKKLSLALSPNSLSTHEGIECNECGKYPIVGNRFICLVCEEYDLCEGCYQRREHPHQFKLMSKSRFETQRRALQEYNQRPVTNRTNNY